MIKRALRKVIKRSKSYQRHIGWLLRDARNKLQYGLAAPVSCQRIFVDPKAITRVIDSGVFDRSDSGRVVGGDWDLFTSPIEDFPKYLICHERFLNGKSWEEAGAYQLMTNIIQKKPGADGCRSFEDIVVRYQKLDQLYQWISSNRILLNRKDLKQRNFRESGGVYVHINRDGEVVFAGGGCHRLAIAKILELDVMPAQLGVLHLDALKHWRSRITTAST